MILGGMYLCLIEFLFIDVIDSKNDNQINSNKNLHLLSTYYMKGTFLAFYM